MNKLFLLFIALLVAAGAGAAFLLKNPPEQGSQQAAVSETQPPAQLSVSSPSTVVYSELGYTPKEIQIKQGDTVVFKNESSGVMWPATAFHPTHTVYPNSSIFKCGTSEEGIIFDACREIERGKEWSFQFHEIGSWRYHDHRIPTRNGTIIIE